MDKNMNTRKEIQSRISEITQNRARRGVGPGTLTVVQCVADDVAAHKNRIVHAADIGQHVFLRHQRRVDCDLHVVAQFFDDA